MFSAFMTKNLGGQHAKKFVILRPLPRWRVPSEASHRAHCWPQTHFRRGTQISNCSIMNVYLVKLWCGEFQWSWNWSPELDREDEIRPMQCRESASLIFWDANVCVSWLALSLLPISDCSSLYPVVILHILFLWFLVVCHTLSLTPEPIWTLKIHGSKLG